MNHTNTVTLHRNSGHYKPSFSRVTSPCSSQFLTMPKAHTHTHTHEWCDTIVLLHVLSAQVSSHYSDSNNNLPHPSNSKCAGRPGLPTPSHKQLYWQGHDNLLSLSHVISSLYLGSTCTKIQGDGCHSLQTCTQNSPINYCNTSDCLSLE
jgi:hypothetical protein